MKNSAHFHSIAPVFNGMQKPETGTIVGYAAIIDKLVLPVPILRPVALICNQNKTYLTEDWRVFPPSYLPDDNKELAVMEALYKHPLCEVCNFAAIIFKESLYIPKSSLLIIQNLKQLFILYQ